MKSILSAKQRILGIISAIILMAGAVGVYTYSQFSNVVNKISKMSTEDPGISQARKILSNITQAENKIKRYSLTEDTLFLEQFIELPAAL